MVPKKSTQNIFGITFIVLTLFPAISYAQLTPPNQEYVLRFADRSIVIAPDDPVFNLGNEFTLTVWVYMEKYQNRRLILGRENIDSNNAPAYKLTTEDNAETTHELEFIIGSQSIRWEYPTEEWFHLGLTVQADTARLFINGIQEGWTEITDIPEENILPFVTGMSVNEDGTPGSLGFTGMLKQISIWNIAKKQSEIVHIAEDHVEETEEGLVAYWKMEEFPSDNVPDSGPNELHMHYTEGISEFNENRFNPLWYLTEAIENPYFNIHEIKIYDFLGIDDHQFSLIPLIIDFSHDGLNDLIFIQRDMHNEPPYEYYPVHFLENKGGFEFENVSNQYDADAIGMFEFRIHDFDGDGFDDFVTAGIGYDFPPTPGMPNALFLSSENYSRASEQRYPTYEKGFTHGLASGDINNDGGHDIFEPNWGNNINPKLFINNGKGFFTNVAEDYLPETYILGDQAAIAVHLADINRDGFDDFIMGVSEANPDYSYERDRLLINTKNGSFQEHESAFPDRLIESEPALPYQIVSADFDGDGFLDLFTTHFVGDYDYGFNRLYKNNGDSTFIHDSSGIESYTLKDEFFARARTDDFNSDGWPDVYLEGDREGAYLFLNDGSGMLKEVNSILTPKIHDGSWGMDIGDLNNDGRADIVQLLPYFQERTIVILEAIRNYDTGASPIPVPQAPRLTGPEDGAETNHKINFSWEEQSPHPFSDFQLATDLEFTEVVESRDRYTGLTISVDSLDLDQTYYWRLRGENYTGEGEWSEVRSFSVGTAVSNEREFTSIPDEFALNQNYPNPFNPTTTITFALPEAALVRLEVYSMLGQKVTTIIDERRAAGTHQIKFDASNLSSGLYVYQLQAGTFIQNRKMLLIK